MADITRCHVQGVSGMIQHHPVHGMQHGLHSMNHMGMGIVMQHDETPCRHARSLLLNGNTKVSKVPCTAYICHQFLLADIPWQEGTE
jgi:hypothetical protein